jgi:hypothetical protein
MVTAASTLFFTVLLSLSAVLSSSFRSYPLFKQCADAWGSDEMGVAGAGERSTVCGEGCAMSSLAMVLAGARVRLPGGAGPTALAANPQSFNSWLLAHNGYTCIAGDCNNLVLDAVQRLNASIQLVGELPKPSLDEIHKGLDNGTVAWIAHIPALTHFVLLTGYDARQPDALAVNDAYFNATSYLYENISDILVYRIPMEPVSERAAPQPRAPARRK